MKLSTNTNSAAHTPLHSTTPQVEHVGQSTEWIYDEFERKSRLSAYWHNRASDLRAGAVVLSNAVQTDGLPQDLGFPDGFCFSAALPGVFALNAGLSIELLLKACIVRRDGNKEAIPLNHELDQLAERADFKLIGKRRLFLQLLSQYVNWAGRYPIPRNRGHHNHADEIFKKGWQKVPGSLFSRFDKDLVVNLKNYNQLWTEINEHFWSIDPAVVG